MKAILLSLFCVLASNIQGQVSKKDTIDKYVIDKQIIERFDGTQLEGKTVSKYIIAYKDAGKTVEKNHIIFTDKQETSLNGKPVKIMKYEGLIIVDGKEIPLNDLSKMKTDEITNMEVYKSGSKVAQSYGEKGKNGVLMITTKTNKHSENIYIIDGKRVDKKVVSELPRSKIASMNISKKEGMSVVDIVTKK